MTHVIIEIEVSSHRRHNSSKHYNDENLIDKNHPTIGDLQLIKILDTTAQLKMPKK